MLAKFLVIQQTFNAITRIQGAEFESLFSHLLRQSDLNEFPFLHLRNENEEITLFKVAWNTNINGLAQICA